MATLGTFDAVREGPFHLISFGPTRPYNKDNPMAADFITYELPWAKDNETAMQNAATVKYGPVSIGDTNMLWCDKPLTMSGMGCRPDSAILKLAGTTLKLSDPAWQNATLRFLDQQKSVKPQF